MDKRLLSLALEALLRRKAETEAEIAQIQEVLAAAQAPRANRVARKRRGRTAAQRKAQSERMKAIWAKRRAAASGTKAAKKA